MTENETLPDIEQLSKAEFLIDHEEKKRLDQETAQIIANKCEMVKRDNCRKMIIIKRIKVSKTMSDKNRKNAGRICKSLYKHLNPLERIH